MLHINLVFLPTNTLWIYVMEYLILSHNAPFPDMPCSQPYLSPISNVEILIFPHDGGEITQVEILPYLPNYAKIFLRLCQLDHLPTIQSTMNKIVGSSIFCTRLGVRRCQKIHPTFILHFLIKDNDNISLIPTHGFFNRFSIVSQQSISKLTYFSFNQLHIFLFLTFNNVNLIFSNIHI